MRLYLAGPMTGLPQYNYPAFQEARETLRRKGHEVICPAEITEINGIDYNNLPENFLPNQLAWCFDAVMRSEAVAVLPAWGKSVGARAEVLIATMTGKPVYAYHQFRPEVLEPLTNINIVTRAEMIARA